VSTPWGWGAVENFQKAMEGSGKREKNGLRKEAHLGVPKKKTVFGTKKGGAIKVRHKKRGQEKTLKRKKITSHRHGNRFPVRAGRKLDYYKTWRKKKN